MLWFFATLAAGFAALVAAEWRDMRHAEPWSPGVPAVAVDGHQATTDAVKAHWPTAEGSVDPTQPPGRVTVSAAEVRRYLDGDTRPLAPLHLLEETA